jgi:CHAT domain-containing protein/tetratricopeptide (TPR) repeat protein
LIGLLLLFILFHVDIQAARHSEILQDETVLTRDAGFETKLAGGQAHVFKISIAAAQYLRVVVEQRGIIIMATLFDPEGRQLMKTDNPAGAYGPVYVSTISESIGDYKLEIRSTESWANSGTYKVSIEELREATTSDRKRLVAEKNYSDGRQLVGERVVSTDGQDPLKKYKDAQQKFEEALSYWQLVGNRHWIALTEYCLAMTYRSLGDRKTASQHFDKSLAVKVDESDWRLRATVFNDRGANYWRLNELEKALESFYEALRIYREHQDQRGQASALNNIGSMYLAQTKYREALESFQTALPLRRAANDKRGEAILLSNIASVSERLGEPHVALEGYRRVLKIWQELESRGQLDKPASTLAAGFNNLALAHDRIGEWQSALENYEKALSLYKSVAPVEAARTLDNIGELYFVLGDTRRAMDYYNQARTLATDKDPDAEVNILSHIGQLHVTNGKLSEALTHFKQALALRKDAPQKANVLLNVGAVYAAQRNPKKALETYELAFQLSESSEDRRATALALQRMGEARISLGQPAKALEALNRALPLWKAVVDKRREAATLHAIALADRERGDLSGALKRSQESRNIIESLRTKVASQRLRSSFFESQQRHYELYIDLRMKLHQTDGTSEHAAASLEASEQFRARNLVETLTEARAKISRGVNEELLRREREAQQRINDKARVQMDLLNRKHSKEEAANIEKELNEAIVEYDAVKAGIRASSPEYAQLTQPQSLTLGEIQNLLDDETLLLEFFLGEERSYLWLVSRTSIVGVDSLPKRAEIESRAGAFYKSLTQRDSNLNNTGSRARSKKDAASPARSNPGALSQILLGPIADRIGKKRLLIVGDGVLQYLPFGALPTPAPRSMKAQKSIRKPYLIEEHEIIYLPSASTLAVLRREADAREPAPLSVAVLADPIFTAEDDRYKAVRQTPTLRSGLELVPLPATEKEAEAIREAMSPNGRIKIAKGFEASRATVLELQDQGYRIVHFATHGDLDAEHPELSSIVLSLLDSSGRPQDGFLRLHDIYNLRLPADLIVLSACSTGLGRIIKGEGLIGLTRGFMHAGSPRVVASLWRVEDLGTSELMKRFYQHMAKEGMAPPMALRQAQVEMLRSKRWNSPYHWAGFVLQGEWKQIH